MVSLLSEGVESKRTKHLLVFAQTQGQKYVKFLAKEGRTHSLQREKMENHSEILNVEVVPKFSKLRERDHEFKSSLIHTIIF